MRAPSNPSLERRPREAGRLSSNVRFANTTTMALTLFGLRRSVYTRIVRLALEEKRVPYRLTEVEIFGPDGVPTEHRLRHPFGRIPVLDHDGLSIFETAAITRYIDERFEGPRLQPVEAGARARMNQVIGVLDSYAYRPMVWGIFVQQVRLPMQGLPSDEQQITKSIGEASAALAFLEGLAPSSASLTGNEFSLADIHAYPMLCYLALAPEGAALLQQYHRLHEWLARMRGRASVQATVTPYEPEAHAATRI